MKASTMANRLRKLHKEMKQLGQALRDDKRAAPRIIQDAMESERGKEAFREHYKSVEARLNRISEIEKKLQTLARAYERNERDAERLRGRLMVARAYAAFGRKAGKTGIGPKNFR